MNPRFLPLPLRGAALVLASAALVTGCKTGLYDEGDGEIRSLSSGTEAASTDASSAGADADSGSIRLPLVGAESFSMAFPTGDRKTSAILLTKEVPAEVIRGQEFEYRLEVKNLTDRALEAVQVTDTIPTGLEVKGSEPKAQVSGTSAVWNLGTLAPGASKLLSVKGVPSDMGQLTSCASVSYESMLCATTNVVSPALDIVLVAPAEGLACDPLDVTVKVTNSGTGDARDVRVTEELPAGLTTLAGQRRIVMDFGTLASSQTKEQTIKLKASQGGTFEQSARAEAAGNLSADAAKVTTLLKEPVLTVAVQANDRVMVGRPISGTIQVANTGDAASDATKVRLALPSGIDVVQLSEGGSSSANALSWDLGTLEIGESRELSYIISSNKGQDLAAEATASGRCAADVTASATTQIKGIPALLLEVVDEEDLILVGEPVTYDIKVTNQGSAKDEAIVITCEVEDGVEIVSAEGASLATVEGRMVTFAPVASLDPGEEIGFQVTVRSSKQFDSRFMVKLTSKQKTRPVSEEESTNFFN